MSFSLLVNPFAPFASAIILTGLVVGFTPPHSIVRPALFPAVLWTVWMTYKLLRNYQFEHSFYSNFLGGSSCSVVLKYIDLALISRWSYEAQGPTSSGGGVYPIRQHVATAEREGNLIQRLRWGIGQVFQERLYRTPWQTKGCPVWDAQQPDRNPSRNEFLARTGATTLVYSLLLDILSLGASDTSANPTNFAIRKVPFFSQLINGELTAEDIVVRILGSMIWWIAANWLLQVLYNSIAFGAVLSNVSSVDSWPPMFGPWSECWSIRQFWGRVWQQCLRRKMSSISHYVNFTALPVQKGTILGRYTFIFGVFFTSGVAHIVADLDNEISFKESMALRFYLTQAMGIVVEDGGRAAYRSLRGRVRDGQRPTGWERTLGYIWTFCWLVWTTPAWAYPSMARSKPGHILPFSLLRLVKGSSDHF